MVSENTTTHTNRFTEPVALCNGPRIAALVEQDPPPIEVINAHVSRCPITPEWLERHPHLLANLPRSERVNVETPDRVVCPVDVRVMALEGYLYFCGHQSGICRGEDPFKGGEFPRASELLAERIALQVLWARG